MVLNYQEILDGSCWLLQPHIYGVEGGRGLSFWDSVKRGDRRSQKVLCNSRSEGTAIDRTTELKGRDRVKGWKKTHKGPCWRVYLLNMSLEIEFKTKTPLGIYCFLDRFITPPSLRVPGSKQVEGLSRPLQSLPPTPLRSSNLPLLFQIKSGV